MKTKIITIMAVLLLTIMPTNAQTYTQLWKQVADAQGKDLPRTAVTTLRQIAAKARREGACGQLLKAELLDARLTADVAPDSLRPAVDRLEQCRAQLQHDPVLQAVYATVLSVIYADNPQLGDDHGRQAADYRRQAMAHPELLAAQKADAYVPLVVKGADSQLYGHDLLSVVGSELGAWQWLSSYYTQAANRPAACLTALEDIRRNTPAASVPLARSVKVGRLDSLLALYGDLPEAGEVAHERYGAMSQCSDVSDRQRYDWLQYALGRWPAWKRAAMLTNELTLLTNPTYSVSSGTAGPAEVGKTCRLDLQMRNVQSLHIRIFRTSLQGNTRLNPADENDYRKIARSMTELKDHALSRNYTGHAPYETYTDSALMAGLPAGVYLVEMSSQPQTTVSRSLHYVSGLRVLIQPQPGNRVRYVVVDATTGHPVARAQLDLVFSRGWQQPEETKTLTADAQGEVLYDGSQRMPTTIFAHTAADSYAPAVNSYGRYTYYDYRYNNEHTSLFTDRAIYRPGQTLHAAAIVWKETSETTNEAVEGKSVTFQLRDANYKVVAEQQTTTDRYGKCTAQFSLPTGLLNGRYTVRAGNVGTTVRVEEYKRPAFQVAFDDYVQPYQQGDTVRMQGRATTYAGVPVQGATVHYTVRRKVAFWWAAYCRYWQHGYAGRLAQEETLCEGETRTADDGTFVALMPMLLPGQQDAGKMFYHFVVEADVTDQGGETHAGSATLPLATKPTALLCDIPAQIRRDQLPQVSFSRRNAAGKEIEGLVSYRIDNSPWQTCAANSPADVLKNTLKTGRHTLQAVCQGDTVGVDFVVFSLSDKKPAATTHDWFYVSHTQFPANGAPVTLQVGSSDPDLHIVYGIFAGNKVLESGSVQRNGELVNRQFTYRSDYGNGLLVTYAWVKDGQCYHHEQLITRPMPDKHLTMQWETFRDRLLPGQQEEWRLRITGPDGKPAPAQLMAVLYDKSLDQLAPHQWSFSPASYLPQPSTSWLWTAYGQFGGSGSRGYRLLTVKDLSYSYFDHSVYPQYSYGRMLRGPVLMQKSMAAVAAVDEVSVSSGHYESKAAGANMAMKETAAADADMPADDQQTAGEQQVQLRQNMQETAFFYPALEAGGDGGVTLRFTLPESLTTWRFMGLSHTPDMLYGGIEAEAVAQKEVMLQPNMPRFVRKGDQARLTARIINTDAGKDVSGVARMLLVDPETDSVVFRSQQPFTVAAGQTAAVAFDFSPAADTPSLLVCKMVASGDNFSDGEQHYLPVLPDREMVTRTVPITQHEAGVVSVDVAALFPAGSSQQKLTVEYTNNPVWLMVQALPAIGQPREASAIGQAAAYYSNALADYILKQNPQARNVFGQWKQEPSQSTSLASQLEQNQELKELLLNETPWVADADQEAAQKQRLADFFDQNLIANRLSTAVEKLKKLQNADGSFSWYPDMPGSQQITVAILEMMTRLTSMTGQQADTEQMQASAFGYMGKEMVKLVDEMKKQEKKGVKTQFPSFTALRWLYVCAIDGRRLTAGVQAANTYLTALLKKEVKRQTIYEKALTAVVLAKQGEKTKAAEYVKSLKEYSVYTEEMGRYYDTPRAAYSWYDYKIPTEVAAMEAIMAVAPEVAENQQAVEEMRRWLLQEKRTQTWNTPINTVNAVYAFLSGNIQQNPLLAGAAGKAQLALDSHPLELPAATAGLGYVKVSVSQPAAAQLTVTKNSDGTSWGAVYAQFMQQLTHIEASQSGITVKREVMAPEAPHAAALQTQSASASGGEGTGFKVGDRIKVRITIETSRDLDFVEVTDRRAACMEPVSQLSGYRNGAYVSPKDNATHYFYDRLPKGRHQIETEYYLDRAGRYVTGTCVAGCAYAPEFRATAPAETIEVNP